MMADALEEVVYLARHLNASNPHIKQSSNSMAVALAKEGVGS